MRLSIGQLFNFYSGIGGADSSAVAAIVGTMCQLVTKAADEGHACVIHDIQRITGKLGEEYKTLTPSDLANVILHTTYMGTNYSSAATKDRAARLGKEIGSYHLSVAIDAMIEAVVAVFESITGKRPKFTMHGGENQQDLALQNIQARLRMVFAYLLAQLLPWIRGNKGFLLVLGSANVDEGNIKSLFSFIILIFAFL